MTMTAEEILAGGSFTYEIEIPGEILNPNGNNASGESKNIGNGANNDNNGEGRKVTLKPLTVKDIQLIVKAAKEDTVLTSALMLSQALVKPKLSHEQIASMHGGLVKFLLNKVNQISGLGTSENSLADLVQAPLARACFILAKEFGWTPQQVSEMTIGQILIYLEMVTRKPPASN